MPDSSVMAKLIRLVEGLTNPMPTVVGNQSEEVNQKLNQMLDYDSLRPLIRATNYIVADDRLPLGPGVLGRAPFPGNGVALKSTDDAIIAHELGHVRQGITGRPKEHDDYHYEPFLDATKQAVKLRKP